MVRLRIYVSCFPRVESTVFKTIAIDHSATSPHDARGNIFAGVAALSIVFFGTAVLLPPFFVRAATTRALPIPLHVAD